LTSNRFFIKKSNIHSSSLLLYGDEHHHLSKVARIKPGEKVWLFEKKIERWKKIALEAVKQSQMSFLPSISHPIPVEKLVEGREEEKKLLLSENRGKYLRDILIENSNSELRTPKSPSSVLILVGPEGGWTDEEEKYILNHGYEAVSLGGQTLRADTAALCSLALISHFWNL
jgi:16S rRNA (uracil1498-N3)-methyltransferase